MRCSSKSDRHLDEIMDRISLLLAYLEEALRELVRKGVVAEEIGISELDYREVFRGIMAELDRM